ncbi:MAG: hypothetical protein HOP02_12510 [Methylococcaceae bacterium]|nr:hypothetical protein [Methylococcaceae bacterium]
MTVALIREGLGWCAAINLSVLYTWFFILLFAHDWVFQVHRKWFKQLREEQFDAIHYGGMALFKLGIILFNLTPYLALLIVG